MNAVTVDVLDAIATISLNRPNSYNALTPEDYNDIAEALRVIDKREDVLVTVWQAFGKFFCAGANVNGAGRREAQTIREAFLTHVARSNTDLGHALSSHSKILVAALNGPVMALLGHFDFIYALPSVWLAVPFTYLGKSILGLVAEGGASVNFVDRMGISRANEALLFGKKLTAEDLEKARFINKIFPEQSVASFHANVRSHLLEELEGLDPRALLAMKNLIKAGMREKNAPEAVNLRESYAQSERFAGGVPRVRFGMLARKEIRHKL
ncbi:ClpP/crotonase [Ramaria rubella]|nr:ClpP/crotonase [Ramaria rubella]